MNGHDPCAYLKNVLMRLPTQQAREIGPLLPVATGSNGSKEALLERPLLADLCLSPIGCVRVMSNQKGRSALFLINSQWSGG
jgi:hypothetical protein